MGNVYYGPDWPELARQRDDAAMNFAVAEAAWSVWQKAEQQRNTFHITGRERLAFLTSYRAVRQASPYSSLQPYMRWRLPVWTDRDRDEFDIAVRQAGAKVHRIEIPARSPQ